MLPLAAAAFTFLALALLVAGLAQRTVRAPDARVRALGARSGDPASAALPFHRRVVAPLIAAVGGWSASFFPAAFLRRTERRLLLAGQPLSATAFYTLALASGALFAGSYFALIFAASHGTPAVIALLPGVMSGGL